MATCGVRWWTSRPDRFALRSDCGTGATGRTFSPAQGHGKAKDSGNIRGPAQHVFPDVATFVEQRFRSLVVREWFAFFAPARFQRNSLDALSLTLQQAIARPELAAAFADLGMLAVSSTPAALASRISQEQQYWQPTLAAAGVRAE